MAYNAVPEVETGDLWTAANHNTYIRDNFAETAPAKVTTKGDLVVGTGANAIARQGVGTNNQVLMADSAQANGVKWGRTFVPFLSAKTNASWDGDSKSTGTTTIDAHTFHADIPEDAVAVLVTVSAKWGSANSGYELNIAPSGAAASNCVKVRSLVADFWMDAQGIVPLDGDGEFDVKIDGASAEVYLDVWGYFL